MIRTIQWCDYVAAVEDRARKERKRQRFWRRYCDSFEFAFVLLVLIPPAKLTYEIAKVIVRTFNL